MQKIAWVLLAVILTSYVSYNDGVYENCIVNDDRVVAIVGEPSVEPEPNYLLNYRFIPSSELQLLAEIIVQYLYLFPDEDPFRRTSKADNPFFHVYSAENMRYDEYLVFEEYRTAWFESRMMNHKPRIFSEKEYYELLGTPSVIYLLKRVDIGNDGEDRVVLTSFHEYPHALTTIYNWCDTIGTYIEWFTLQSAFDVIYLNGSYFLVRGAHFGDSRRYFDILYIEGDEARGMRIGCGYGGRGLEYNDLPKPNDHNFINPRAFNSGDKPIFNLILE